jgi:hypothetical protein
MPQSPVDQEEFQAWLDHPVTAWVRRRLKLSAEEVAQSQADLLFNRSPAATAAEWADQQAKSAQAKGLCDGLMQFVLLDYDAVREETDEEIAEMEKKAQ